MLIGNLSSLFADDKDLKDFEGGGSLKADSLESLALSLAASFNKEKKNLAVVLPTLFDAHTFIDFLSQFVSEKDILFYPYDEVLRIEAISSSKEMEEERLYSLSQLVSSDSKHIFVSNSIALLHEVSPLKRFKEGVLRISAKDIYPPEKLADKLVSLGYSRVGKVESVFEFSWRGEIFDIFTPSNPDPYRIEYFDDRIDDIRLFSSKDEMSFEDIQSFLVTPAHENLFSHEECQEAILRIKLDLEQENKLYSFASDELNDRTERFINDCLSVGVDENQTRYLPYFLSSHTSVLSYLKDYRVLFYRPEDISSTADSYYLEAVEYFEQLNKAHLALKKELNCFKLEQVLSQVKSEYVDDEKGQLTVSDIPYHFVSVMDADKMIRDFLAEGYTIHVFLAEDKMLRFKETMLKNGFITSELKNYCEHPGRDITRGFLIPFYKVIVLSSKEIFGLPEGNSFFLKRFREAKILNKYQDLTPGDYVVHEEQGIGRYLGIKEIEGLEYLEIQYEGEDARLYVPLDKYKLIRKYSSKEGLQPKLDRLGGATWARRKSKIRGRVAYLADRLLEIQAKRKALPGFAFQKDDEIEEMFGEAFPYQLTLAQTKSLEEIKADMMSPHPMDRLLAGDVGFGKTEVAFRAVFKAILSGKQAALLCPTTVLCQQHFDVALRRFEGFGTKIAMLSRNVSDSEQKKTIEELKEGKIDFVIGTHRLLSDDVSFKDLGLLVVDEEQRFGVTHKEKIKEKFSSVDVLTLTATPIPRTLQMSLLNVRSLSLLDDPPINRLPIKTYVVRYNKDLVKEVIARELGRNGQIYYLHNRIQTIYKKAEELKKLFPNASVGVVHGQLSSDEMANAMNDFYEGKTQILVCTTIIETGLDVSNCNTLIVENAQNFGLAQLYQIKGRVGRSSRLAYAYLMYPEYLSLDEDARKRLKALKDFTELGSGFKIANEDLNIRGAGDILGKEQAGFIDSIGYDAYMNLLKEVMNEKTLQDKAKTVKKNGTRFELSFSLDSHIPSEYASEADRINIYRELFDINTEADLIEYEKKVRDVYGHFPEEMNNLFLKKRVEVLLDSPLVSNFREYIDHYDIRMTKEYSTSYGIGTKLMAVMEKYDRRKFVPHFYASAIEVTVYKTTDYLMDLFDVITTLLKTYQIAKKTMEPYLK
jgi:transcription-repair coupling factor (superfamily II helicase)